MKMINNYMMKIKFDGSYFYGSQKQCNKVTVNGVIENILSKIFDEKIHLIGCSRTDRGVHANDYVINFKSKKSRDIEKLKISLNKLLYPSIYIKDIKIVDMYFDARRDVKLKKYIYKINIGEYIPTQNKYVLEYNKDIDVELLQKSIIRLSGEHDFTSFTSDKRQKNYIRKISISLYKKDEMLYIIFSSRSFLRYMIRNIVGLLLDINEGRKKLEDIDYIFESKDRKVLGKPAMACGLYLEEVEYYF